MNTPEELQKRLDVLEAKVELLKQANEECR